MPPEDDEVLDRGDAVEDSPETPPKDEPAKVEAKADEPPKDEVPAPSGQMVPLSRFQAQNVRLREQERAYEELQARFEEMEKQRTPSKEEAPKARDFVTEAAEVEKKLEAAIADNDIAAVAAANRELRAIDRAELEYRMGEVQQSTAQVNTRIELQAFEETLTAVETEYPELDPTSSTANETKIDAAQALVAAYEGRGYSSSDALIKAVSVLYPETPAVETPAASTPPRGIKDKIAAVATTPPNLSKAGGENSDAAGMQSELDPALISDDEFDKLPEATKRRLRGDAAA